MSCSHLRASRTLYFGSPAEQPENAALWREVPMAISIIASTPIHAVLSKPLSAGWNRIPGIKVSGTSVTIRPAEFFFEYSEPRWVVCDWELVEQVLLGRGETSEATYEQRVADFVHEHGRTVDAGADVLRVAEQVYGYLFRAEHLDDSGVRSLGVDEFHLDVLRQMGIIMALNRVELSGQLSVVSPAWFFPVCSKKVFDLDQRTADMIDELYHGTFFNEKRRVESVLAHAALGGRLVHGCQSVPDMAGGCVVAYGTDINAFYANLRLLKQDWIEKIASY